MALDEKVIKRCYNQVNPRLQHTGRVEPQAMGTESSIFNPVIITIIGSQVGIVAILVAAVVPLAFRIGRLPTREEHTALQKEVTANKEELKAEIANAEARLGAEIANTEERLRAEIEKSKNEVLQEVRRSHQQIMLAPAHHTNGENGQAVFTLPPGVELAPAPTDD